MTSSRSTFPLGAAALVLCLALPMGLLSLLAPPTASDQLASADAVVLARVNAVQTNTRDGVSHVSMLVQERLIGAKVALMQRFELPGATALRAGDTVLALIDSDERALLGTYQVAKRDTQRVVAETVEGFAVEGLPSEPGQPLEAVVQAFRLRLGLIDPSDVLGGEAVDDEQIAEGTAGDDLEPNDTLAEASPIFPAPPGPVTGLNPLLITGLTITPGDVDFFSFTAGGPSILHAETRLPAGATSLVDTLIGFFDGTTGQLVAVDDDGAAGPFSRLIVPVERTGANPYALAVESAPDTDLDFSGDEGTTSGPYDLQIEFEKASYLSNTTDQLAGVSPDGTFIEDLVGYKEVFGSDVLLQGVAGDGWGLSFDVTLPSGLTTISGGAGDFLVPPSFGHELRQVSFEFGPFVDVNGFNRAGSATSVVLLPYDAMPVKSAQVTHRYTVGLNQSVIRGRISLAFDGNSRVADLALTRLLDVDVFGGDDDEFFWSFPANGRVKAYPVSTTTAVGDVTPPAQTDGSMTGDLQAVLSATALPGEELPPKGSRVFDVAFTLVTEFVSKDDAVQSAAQNLIASDVDAWVIAVDADPETGLYTAFAAGIRDPRP